MNGAFAKVEHDLLRVARVHGLEHGHVLFLALIRSFDYDGKGCSWRGQETYADLLGISARTVGRWTEILRARGLISVVRRDGVAGRRGTNEISWDGLSAEIAALSRTAPDDTTVSGGPSRHATELRQVPCDIAMHRPTDIAASQEAEEAEAEQDLEEGVQPEREFRWTHPIVALRRAPVGCSDCIDGWVEDDRRTAHQCPRCHPRSAAA